MPSTPTLQIPYSHSVCATHIPALSLSPDPSLGGLLAFGNQAGSGLGRAEPRNASHPWRGEGGVRSFGVEVIPQNGTSLVLSREQKNEPSL